ncbi:hypothetical protein VaNZ11_008041 [Volvox africanus]|uniref:Uncharacterized protein n=1 Tax=Volvox africanus TaxID=51714 RepID=A0ABQ5S5S3_9CHLO|nr:hypothetical protein VaNZ11_008041 [Volvox africanus]
MAVLMISSCPLGPNCAKPSRRASYSSAKANQIGVPKHFKNSKSLHTARRLQGDSLLYLPRASDDRGIGSFGNDSSDDITFIGKVAGISFAGAAAIKYGSLILDIPFQPNALLAMLLVLGPPAAYALLLWMNSPPKI